MKKAGYAFLASAADGSAQHRSGGVMVAWRRHLAVSGTSGGASNPRFVSTVLRHTVFGEVNIGSIYVHQGDRLTEGSPADALLASVFLPLRDEGRLCIIGGDFNQSPRRIAEWLHSRALPFRVVAQTDHTFVSRVGASNIDFS